MRVGILTGGGDCQGINAAIRAVAKSLMHEVNADIIGIEEGFLGLIEQRIRPLTWQDVSGILPLGGTTLGTCNIATPFNYNGQDLSQDVLNYYQSLQLDCIVAMGGDGTMTLCHEMAQLGMNFIGIPKTIDNDLAETDRTFGFDSAVQIATDAIDRLQTTAQSHKRVIIVETMGRYAGWIALHAGMAGGADIILIPEYPYDIDEVIKQIELRAAKQSFTIIAIAEGARPIGGHISIAKNMTSNSPDKIRLGGISSVLQQQIEARIDSEVRTTVIGHVQRGGSPSAYDRLIATNVGCYAASLVASKHYGRMVTVHNNHLSSVALAEVAHNVRGVPRDDMTLISALSMGISLGDPSLKIPLSSIKDDQAIVG